MNRLTTSKLRLLGELCTIAAIAGIIYQLLYEGIVDYRAFLTGVSLGLAFGIMELFILRTMNRNLGKLPFVITIIYQYVGDEVIFTWKTKEGLSDSNCLKIFFKIHDKIYNKRKYYRNKYGEVPFYIFL